MKKTALILASALAASALAPASFADGLNPGSVLIYPIHRSNLGMGVEADDPADAFTLISITNVNLNPVDGDTNVHYEYVNVIGKKDKTCTIVDRVEHLTPADTLSVLTNCHNAADDRQGYLVVSAENPDVFNQRWSFNHLIGSELVIDKTGTMYSLNAIPFESPQDEGERTDLDGPEGQGDGQLDFDGVEYEGIPEHLYLDSFIAAINSNLILINLTGGVQFDVIVAFDIFNDNEFPLSATTEFNCWMDKCLAETETHESSDGSNSNGKDDCISLVFSEEYLKYNTPNDKDEVDLDCMADEDGNKGDLETGWARVRGLVANSAVQSILNPALLGATSNQELSAGGRRLWETVEKQLNGDFLNFGVTALD